MLNEVARRIAVTCAEFTGPSMAREEFPAFRTCRQRGTNIVPATTSQRSAIPLSQPPSNDKALGYNFPMRAKTITIISQGVCRRSLREIKPAINLLGILYTSCVRIERMQRKLDGYTERMLYSFFI